jgi:hypothetical protein
MKVKIILPKEVEDILPTFGNISKQKSLIKVYNALILKSKYKNSEGYFEVSSRYLLKVNNRYYNIIKFFEENGIIKTLKREYLQGDKYGPTDIFTEKIEKVSYSVKYNITKKYKFLIDTEIGKEYEIEFKDPKLDKRWYKILKNSLNTLGYDFNKISRDRYGARVYHPLIAYYKEELKGKGFCTIDAKCSQPRLLYLLMKEKECIDKDYFYIFENNKDFYLEMLNKLDIIDRQEAKHVFMMWALGNGYTKGYDMRSIFPVTTKFLENLKSTNHKNSSRYLSWKESRIWIDDLLENLPVSFGIPIHDCIIVYQKDAEKVLSYCKSKYPQIEFDFKEL